MFLGLMMLTLTPVFLLVALNDGLFSNGEVRFQLLAETQVNEYRRWLQFPGIFGVVLSQINGAGGICAIILAAGALGSEYNWGTLRLQLSRQPRRGLYLIVKVVAILLVLTVGIIVALLVGSLLGWLFGMLLGDPGSIAISDLLLLPLGILRSLFVILPYLLFTLSCCTLGRSVLAGAGGGLIFLTLDASLGGASFFGAIGGWFAFIGDLLLQRNINTLIRINSTSFGLDQSAIIQTIDLSILPSPLQATFTIAFYCALFFISAHYWLVRRDVPGTV
ncbi:MAG: ABC transporter permease [Chloroflexales bacterium]|nr:ABC transporter permease [Chloroflexales bacterium]